MKTEIDKVNDLIIEGLESQIKIKDEITASLRASNEYLLEKLVRFDIRIEELENELKTFK